MKITERRKTILFVTGSMGRGGAERVISLLSDYYIEKGWSVTIAMLLHDKKDGYQLNSSIKIVNLSIRNIKAVFVIPLIAIKLRQLINDIKPDAIACFMAQNTLICGMACIGIPVRMIASERIDPSMVHRNLIYRVLLHHIYAKCDCTILQTRKAWSYFPKKVQNNSMIIPNPIKVSCIAHDHWNKRIVTAGRLELQKNHSLLINAFSEFHRIYSKYVLDIYGEGSKYDDLKRQIHKLGLDDCVSLKGSSPRIHEEIADAAMFVLSSNFEGLSNALLEAMMMGLPVISTNCAGADEAIQNGVNGYLVPTNDIEALTNAMLKMAGNENEMRKLGREARKDALKRYSVDSVIDQWDHIIDKR